MITEQDIQRAFFTHLKEFYRYRYEYEPLSFTTEQNALATGSIIADGVVRFSKTDGTQFLGTFEATSIDKDGEAKFIKNGIYFIWDCFAFATLITAATFGYLYFFKLKMLLGLGLPSIFGLVFTLILCLFSFWYFIMPNWSKYRYIYAIEQFKQYFADEQWVVLGQDVFPHSEDAYMRELRRQCTYNGFGLATIDRHGGVQVLATPSRLGMYGKDRADAHWLTSSTAYHQVSKVWNHVPQKAKPLVALWNKITIPIKSLVIDPINTLFARMGGSGVTELNRYMHSFAHQKWISVLSIGVMFFMGYRTYKHPSFHSDDLFNVFSTFESKQAAEYSNPEDEPGVLPITYGDKEQRGIKKQFPGTNTKKAITKVVVPNDGIERDDHGIQVLDLTAMATEEPQQVPKIESPAIYSQSTDASTASKGVQMTPKPQKKSTWSWCSSLKNHTGWLVQDNYYTSPEGAEIRIKELRDQKISAFSVAGSCFDQKKEGTYIFLKELFQSEEAAIKHLKVSVIQLKKLKLDTGRTIVKKIPIDGNSN
jgi:hypothetical protein